MLNGPLVIKSVADLFGDLVLFRIKDSGNSPNGHFCKWTAIHYVHLHRSPFFSTPIETLYFYISVNGQLQLQTPFPHPKGVHSRELPPYSTTLHE